MWGKTPESEVLSCLNPGWIFGGFFFSNRNKFAIPDSIRRFLSLDTTPHVIVAILTLSRIFYLYHIIVDRISRESPKLRGVFPDN